MIKQIDFIDFNNSIYDCAKLPHYLQSTNLSLIYVP
jgi:hypothetical protein